MYEIYISIISNTIECLDDVKNTHGQYCFDNKIKKPTIFCKQVPTNSIFEL